MIRYVAAFTLVSFVIQTIAMAFSVPLAVRYRIPTLRAGVFYCCASFLSETARLIMVFETARYGYVHTGVYTVTGIMFFLTLFSMTFSLPRMIHGFLEISFPPGIYYLTFLQPLIMAGTLVLYRGQFYEKVLTGVVLVSVPFYLSHLYCVILMAAGISRKNIYNRKLLFFGLVTGLIYIPLGFVDCFWPLFPEIHRAKPAGLGLSTFTALLVGLLVVRYTYPYLIEMGSTAKVYSYTGVQRYSFTEREEEVLLLLVEGYTNDQIAAHLRISTSTVKKHIYNMFQKSGSENRIDLINSCRAAV